MLEDARLPKNFLDMMKNQNDTEWFQKIMWLLLAEMWYFLMNRMRKVNLKRKYLSRKILNYLEKQNHSPLSQLKLQVKVIKMRR